MQKISVFIITKNEEDRVARAIKSVKSFADEILVIDSGSSDNTIKVAKEAGATTYYNEWAGYGPQKIYGESLCKNKWLLNLDADEEVTEELANEIKNLFNSKDIPNDRAGYFIKMIDLPHFCKKAHIFSQYKKYLRLYNKEKASFRNSSVHDAVVVKSGATDILKAKILHRSVRSYSHAIAKLNNYSDMLALDAFHKGKSVNILQLVFIFPLAFIKHFIFRRYFVYGIDGFINAMLYACIRLLKYAKIRELKKKNNG